MRGPGIRAGQQWQPGQNGLGGLGVGRPHLAFDVGLDELGDLLLLSAWQLGGCLENLKQLALYRSGFGAWRVTAEKLFCGDADGGGKLGECVAANAVGPAFECGDGLLGDAELLRQGGLGEACLDASLGDTVAQIAFGLGAGSAAWMHEGRIRQGVENGLGRNK